METIVKHITPALFVSHGSPMNAIEQNKYTDDLKTIGNSLQNVSAILVISAHWETNGIYVTSSEQLSTYHDFGGFPQELFNVEYPVKGALSLIPRLEELIGEEIKQDPKRGLDHGAWSMLVHLFPKGNIPVLQMSLDRTKTFQQHLDLAKKLIPLREENVLILASGNVTHNLRRMDFNATDGAPYDWAVAFDEIVKNAFENDDAASLVNVQNDPTLFKMNHPSDDHFLPLLYLMGVKLKTDHVSFPHMSWQMKAFSMRHILLN